VCQGVNWRRANKTTLLALIRVQNKAVRNLEYDKMKTAVLYSKHKIFETPDLFKLSVAKFMYSFYNGWLPNHFDNNFAEIASIHKYQTRLASLQNYYLPTMKTSLGQLSLTLWRPAGFGDSHAKTTRSHMALHKRNPGAKSGRELFKGSKDMASLSRPVLFNLFCYAAPLKIWRTHAPYLLKHLNSCTQFTDTSPMSPT